MNEENHFNPVMLFNKGEYHLAAGITKTKKFYWKYSKSSHLFIAFAEMHHRKFVSLPNSTFGGIEGNSTPTVNVYDEFIHTICEGLKEFCQEIEIRLPPMSPAYFNVEEQYYSLVRNGFNVVRTDLSYLQTVDEHCFSTKIDYANLKRLKKAKKIGIKTNVATNDELESIYEVVYKNRIANGYEISLSFDQLSFQIDRLSAHVLFSTVLEGVKIATAICVRLSCETLYVMYWGDLPEYRNLSPIVSLAEGIYDYCKSESIKYIDIGTSTFNLNPNQGLMKFKRDLGFRPSLKFTLIKEINEKFK